MEKGYLRTVAHAFHTTCNDGALVAGLYRLGSEHDALHAAGTDFVDSGSVRCDLHAGGERYLACGGLADASLHDIAKVDLLDHCRIDVGLLEGMFECDGAELGSGQGLERSVERSDGRAGGSDDDGFMGGLRGCKRWMLTIRWGHTILRDER